MKLTKQYIRILLATVLLTQGMGLRATSMFIPADPSNLVFGTITTSRIDFSWTDNATGENGYIIERAEELTPTTFTVISYEGPNTTSYSDSPLTDDTRYYYRVSAWDGDGPSGYATGDAQTLLAAPAAPSGLALANPTESSIELTWIDGSDNETYFYIERGTDGINFGPAGSTLAGITFFEDTDLVENTVYYYRVHAWNAAGDSPYSNVASLSTLLLLPGAPSGLSLDNATINSIELTWIDGSDNETYFYIERGTDGINYDEIGSTTAGTTFFVDTGLDDDTEYFYRVHAWNATGYSPYSNEPSLSTLLAIPAAPTGLALDNETENSIELTWIDESDNETYFYIERGTDGTNFDPAGSTLENIAFFEDTGLDDDTEYFYRVYAWNAAGDSPYSNVASLATDLAKPDPPENLMLSNITTTSIDLSWQDESDNEAGFQIERSEDDIDYSVIHVTDPEIFSYSNTGLEDNTQYFYRVRAYNAAGFSAYTDVAGAITQLAVPASPSNLVLDQVTDQSIRLTWLDHSDSESGFEIERSLEGGGVGFDRIHTAAANVLTYTNNTGLTENTEYYYRVRAYNAAGPSDYTSEVHATTLLMLPEAPDGLLLDSITTNSIYLSWNDNSTNEDGFEVQRSPAPGNDYSFIHLTDPDSAFYKDTLLEDDTEYFYRVRAVNVTGPSGYTVPRNATTLLAIPEDPAALEATATQICSIELKWLDLSDNEDGFEIERSLTTSPGDFEFLASVAAEVASYTDIETENGAVYYYRVRAYNDAGYSEYTPIRSVVLNIILDGGLIGFDQNICLSGDPEPIIDLVSPSGGEGTWIYQWQSRVAPALFTDITDATGLSYDPPLGLLENTEYQRVSTTECGSVISNVVTVSVDDIEPPLFTYCPNDTIAYIERNESSGAVLTPDPLAMDNCEIVLLTWSISGVTSGSSPATGINLLGTYTFNRGVSTVTYYAEDIGGNSAQCSYQITVERKSPEVRNVIIPNAPMKIGDVITATIIVGHDAGQDYNFVSGRIGGYALYNAKPFFQSVNDTTYLLNFYVQQGGNSYLAIEDIPVTNLVVRDGSEYSPPYNLPIIQDNDPIDAAIPVITSMNVGPGIKKIGDVVTLNITADGHGYSIHPNSRINNILVSEPNVQFLEVGLNSYVLNYTVQEGDPDAIAGALTASIMLVKPSGNVSDPFTTIGGTGLISIDANAPVVTRMEVPSLEVGVGGTVQMAVTADGEGYIAVPGTTINGIPLGSFRVTFSEATVGLYELAYVVAGGDNSVAPGNLEVNVVLQDAAGNMSGSFSTLEPNTLEIYTDLPNAFLGGPSEICEDEVAELTAFVSGRFPLAIELWDGSVITTYEGISSDSYSLPVTPTKTTTYTITKVIDANGVENIGSGEGVRISVNQKTDVEIINLASGYSVEAERVKLEANVPGGTFSGPGVFSATDEFDPGIADTLNSPHTIYYEYENANGCISVDSALVFVLGGQGGIYIPSDIVCNNGDPFTVSASNVAGVTGSFELLNAGSQPVSGITDHGDNTAEIDPGMLSEGPYTIEYEYFDEVTLYLRKSFTVQSIPQPQFLNLGDSYCQSVTPFILQSDIPGAQFEGPGVSSTLDGNFLFDPSQVEQGLITVQCINYAGSGCTTTAEKSVLIIFTPNVNFTLATNCIPDTGGVVMFNNLTSGKLLTESWSWNFGDPASGDDNFSDLVEPEHFYSTAGEKTIQLSATTFEGCVGTHTVNTLIGNKPVADFSWDSYCFSNGIPIKFYNKTTSGSSEINSLVWRWKTASGGILGEEETGPDTDTVSFLFVSVDQYQVELIASNTAGCFDTISKEILLKPTIEIGLEDFTESFDGSDGSWTVHSEDGNQSWVWDRPDFIGYGGSQSDKAWYTSLPDGGIGYEEHSWVQSPCFDFRLTEKPLIQLDIMRSFVPNMNGAVLQYMDHPDDGWKVVGQDLSGNNWYNSSSITNQPGGSSMGWALYNIEDTDTEWVSAMHDLDPLKGNPRVSFRVAIATTGAQEQWGNQGFAFNNFIISERRKRVLLEHFTNASDPLSSTADDIVEELSMDYPRAFLDIQYHMDYPGMDPMNESNPDPPSSRGDFYYGVPQVPYAILDGGIHSYHRYDFTQLKSAPVGDHIRLLSLEIPAFEIDLSVDWGESELEVTTNVTCTADQYEAYIDLYLVVFETLVTAYEGGNGDTEFRNVVLDMLP